MLKSELLNAIAALDPVSLAKDAYDKDFRWWFLVLLSLVLAGGLWAFKYLLNQAEAQRMAHNHQVELLVNELTESRKHHHDRMEGMQAEAFRMVKDVTEVVTATKVVIESCIRESEKVRNAVERWESSNRK